MSTLATRVSRVNNFWKLFLLKVLDAEILLTYLDHISDAVSLYTSDGRTDMHTLVEHVEVEREYGYDGNMAIVDHEQYGRILITDGFGGIDSLEGGCVRWKHGLAIKIKQDDTIEYLQDLEWNDYTDAMTAILQGYDDERPILDISGYAIEAIAKSVGLQI